MMYLNIINYRRKIDNLFLKYPLMQSDDELVAHWTRYLCILISGYIEISLQTVLREYTNGKSHPRIFRYVDSKISRFQNANMEKLLVEVSQFDSNWRSIIEGDVNYGEMKEAVNSIVGIRHMIAHGGDHSVSPSQLRSYYDRINSLISKLCTHCI